MIDATMSHRLEWNNQIILLIYEWVGVYAEKHAPKDVRLRFLQEAKS